MKEIRLSHPGLSLDAASFLACLGTVLELAPERLPPLGAEEDAATGWTVSRWLGGRGLGLVPVADPTSFAWAGPWIARIRPPDGAERRAVVMYGVPSGLVWDPAGADGLGLAAIEDGFVVAASDIALALPPPPARPSAVGTVEGIHVAPSAGEPVQTSSSVEALAGRGLAGDRHVVGAGTFPSGLPGSALTLIDAEVCESFDPPLDPDEHRRNVVTRGIDLNALVGSEFAIGAVRCRGTRLCEPCRVVEGYASRRVLRALVHRGGLRADILDDGVIRVGDAVEAFAAPAGV